MEAKQKLLDWYQRNEVKLQVFVFVAGFIFDYFTADETDLFTTIQQVVYLVAIAFILSFEHLVESQVIQLKNPDSKWWQYRGLGLHFILGSLLSLYSFFFLKSASIFNSMIFVVLLMALLVANELPSVQKSGLNIRWALWVLCLFSFFTVLFPLLFGFVGWVPFLLAALATTLGLYLHFRWMMKRQKNFADLKRAFLIPGGTVVGVFVVLYFLHLIPPVPLAAKNMGVYHQLEKVDGKFILSHEKPWWKFWQTGDQDFKARPGDSIFFYAQISSPAKFADQVVIHWLYKDPRQGWMSSDKVRMGISGGRKEGFRGYSVKKNYQSGDWRVQVETTDGREIGRLYFELIPDTSIEERHWIRSEF
ncbi:MAG: DUF2914 domain-containing protein [Pseudobdellovibrionaceae bacterium]